MNAEQTFTQEARNASDAFKAGDTDGMINALERAGYAAMDSGDIDGMMAGAQLLDLVDQLREEGVPTNPNFGNGLEAFAVGTADELARYEQAEAA